MTDDWIVSNAQYYLELELGGLEIYVLEPVSIIFFLIPRFSIRFFDF